ncbi:hypothetical protein [Bacillus sp. FSL M8-0052]
MKETVLLEERRMDLIVVQGSEAGGRKGTFCRRKESRPAARRP